MEIRNTDVERTCIGCNATKPLTEYHHDYYRKDGRKTRCMECCLALRREWYVANRERAKETRRRSYYADIEKSRELGRIQQRRRNYRYVYGITEVEFERLKEVQGGRCAICGSVPRRWAVDHDHITGAVRGALCPNCNSGLGMLGDDLARVEAAVAYLRRGRVRAA